MNFSKALVFIILSLFITGCSTTKIETVYKDCLVYQELPDAAFKSAIKPTTFKQDFDIEYLRSVDVTDKELITLLLHKYAMEKEKNISNYMTIVNIKQTLQKQKEEFEKGNVPK